MASPHVSIDPFFAIGYGGGGRYAIDGPSLEWAAAFALDDDADIWELTDTGWVQLAKDDPRLIAAIEAETTKRADRVARDPRWRAIPRPPLSKPRSPRSAKSHRHVSEPVQGSSGVPAPTRAPGGPCTVAGTMPASFPGAAPACGPGHPPPATPAGLDGPLPPPPSGPPRVAGC